LWKRQKPRRSTSRGNGNYWREAFTIFTNPNGKRRRNRQTHVSDFTMKREARSRTGQEYASCRNPHAAKAERLHGEKVEREGNDASESDRRNTGFQLGIPCTSIIPSESQI
jgi:hypothetical protein